MLPRLAPVVIALTLVAGCGGGGSPSSPSSPTTLTSLFTPRVSASSLQGTWTCTMREGFLFGNSKTARITLRFGAPQENTTYTGTWQVTMAEPPRMRSGTFTTTPPFTNVIFGGQVCKSS